MRQDWQNEWLNYRNWVKTLPGFFLYQILGNDLSWRLLNEENREWVHRANLFINTERPEYAQPGTKEGSLTIDDYEQAVTDIKGTLLMEYLEEYQPESVIEIGPGVGYLTGKIATFPSVKRYTGLDINPNFIEYLDPRLKKITKGKKEFSYQLIAGDFKQEQLPPSDSVIFLSAVHHIPDRVELFEKIAESMKTGGTMFSMEPTHYIPRKLLILRKFLRGTYGKEFRSTYRSMGTHNFCTKEEYERVFRKVGGLSIEASKYIRFEFPPIVKPFLRAILHRLGVRRSPERWFILEGKNHPLRFFSGRMSLVARKFE
jgi:SAM-dependent methyltransferase